MRRAEMIRTSDPLTPSQVRYQAAPQPVAGEMLAPSPPRATVASRVALAAVWAECDGRPGVSAFRSAACEDQGSQGLERLRCLTMCGRFVAASPPDELANYFGANPAQEHLEESYNVAPTAKVYAVRAPERNRELAVMRWGLVPFWAKDRKIGPRLMNARSETVATKPAFRSAFKSRRCLIPVDGFFEWAKPVSPGEKKQPYFIHRSDGERLVFAGLWERWSPETPEGESDAAPLETCTILTCAPNTTMAKVHDRMPVLVPPSSWDDWLDPDLAGTCHTELLSPAPSDLLTMYPISTAVNSARNNGPELLEVLS